MTSPPPILADLRQATADDHARLEDMTLGSKIMDGSLTPEEYDRLIKWQASAHRALEPLVAGYAADGYAYRSRFGAPQGGPAGPTVDHDTATGIIYVLEGSSLGGSMIYKKLRENPALSSKAPFAFYRDQADWGLRQWRSFVAYLKGRNFDDAAIARAREGAWQAFARFEAEWKATP